MPQTQAHVTDFIPQFVEELDREAERSRRALLNVPDNMRAWKPHERSMEFGYLADMVATIPHWIAVMANQDEMDIAPKDGEPRQGQNPQTSTQFVRALETAVSDAKAALTTMDVSHLQDSWRLLVAGEVVSDTSRKRMLRETMNHWVHHRGQMTVYLRLMTNGSIEARSLRQDETVSQASANVFAGDASMLVKMPIASVAVVAASFLAPTIVQATHQKPILNIAIPKPSNTGHTEVNGVNYHYAVYGTGESLSLLHGRLGQTEMFGVNLTKLAQKAQLIGVDFQGHGRTARHWAIASSTCRHGQRHGRCPVPSGSCTERPNMNP